MRLKLIKVTKLQRKWGTGVLGLEEVDGNDLNIDRVYGLYNK